MPMSFAIELVQLTKVFRPPRGFSLLWKAASATQRSATVALEDVTLAVQHGEIVGLVGANGAGKTTLLKILATLVLPTSGQVRVNGHDVVRDELAVKGQIGLMTGEERSFYWRLTGRQNLAFFAALYGLSSQEARTRISELGGFLGITDLDRRVQTYSTGMKQRLALARALLHNPPILLLDEPTKSLDPPTAQRLRAFLRERTDHPHPRTVVLATHNLTEAEQLSDRIILLHHGRCIRTGTVAELKGALGPERDSLEEALTSLMHEGT
jgi:ABC-2 type transport system ATP-binding protein